MDGAQTQALFVVRPSPNNAKAHPDDIQKGFITLGLLHMQTMLRLFLANAPSRHRTLPIIRCFASKTGTGASKRKRGRAKPDDNDALLKSFHNVVKGPKLILDSGKMAKQTLASLMGSYEGSSTTVLTTVAAEMANPSSPQQSSSAFLTTDYRERSHAIGRFPKAGHKRDNRMLSLGEVLASRALDRALRPLLKDKL